jgi:hypothetical protein
MQEATAKRREATMAKAKTMAVVEMMDRIQEVVDLSFRENRELTAEEWQECRRLLERAQSGAASRRGRREVL